MKSVRHDVMLQSFVKSIRHDVMLQSLVKSVHHDVMLQSFVKTLRGLSFAVDARCDRGGTRSGLAHHSVAYMLGRHQGQSSRCRRRCRRPDLSVVASYLWCHQVFSIVELGCLSIHLHVCTLAERSSRAVSH